MTTSTPYGLPSTCSSIQFSSNSSWSGENARAPRTPMPPARLTAAATSRQWVKAKIGNSMPNISQSRFCISDAPSEELKPNLPPASTEEALHDGGELDGLVALDAVPGTLDDDGAGVGSSSAQFNHAVSGDDAGQGAADQEHRRLDAGDVVPQVGEPHRPFLLPRPYRVVAPRPRAVRFLAG